MAIEWVKEQIRRTALADRVDPALALATADYESGFNPNAVGDTSTPYSSHGVFQERLILGRGGFTVPDTDVARQTHRFDMDVLAYQAAGGGGSPGEIALAVQRADPNGYADAVNARYGKYGQGVTGQGSPTSCPTGQILYQGRCVYAGRGGIVGGAVDPGDRTLPSTVGRPGAGGAPIPGTGDITGAQGRGAAFDPLAGIRDMVGGLAGAIGVLVVIVVLIGLGLSRISD